jgi:hypothetical protein
MSSLITGEWYMRKLFNGWARPYEFNAQHMLRCGHAEEARDTVSATIAIVASTVVVVTCCYGEFLFPCAGRTVVPQFPSRRLEWLFACLGGLCSRVTA